MTNDSGKTTYQRRFDAAMEYAGVRGNRSAFGAKLNLPPGAAGQRLYNWYKRDQRIPDDQRKALEALGLSIEWINDGTGEMVVRSAVRPNETPPGYVRFQLLEGAAGMGDGVVNEDYPEVIRQVDMAEWEVRRKIGFLPPPGRIQILTGRGPSMRPRIDHGDVVMVDTSVDAFDGDGIYVINVGGETQIKMLQKRDDGMWVVSANPDYPAYRVAEGSAVHVGGRVMATLGVREL